MRIDRSDREVLRGLARLVAEAAADPIQARRTQMWKDHNSLRPQRPMVLAFPEGGWRDLVDEAELQCHDPAARNWEHALRRKLFHIRHIHDDQPVTGFFNVGWAVERGDYGLSETQTRTAPLGSYRWDPPVKTAADLKKLRPRTLRVDREQTERTRRLAEEVLGDILTVRVHGSLWWTCGLTWDLIRLRGLEQVMLDIYENPDLLRRLMAFLRDSMMHLLDACEAEGVLSLNNGPDDYVGSGGVGATGELPADDFAGNVRCRDMWALGESQEFALVGPEQFHEFALRYQLPLLKRFGLICYGCCEKMDAKIDLVVRHVPRLRRVSVSPWTDRALAAEKLADRYIYSWKPNPTLICALAVDWDAVEAVTRETIEIARAHGCLLEMVMKDTHTFCGDRSRIERWTDIASRLAQEAT